MNNSKIRGFVMSKSRIYSFLAFAITIEIIGTMFMELSEGFTKILPTVVVFIFYITSAILSIIILKYMEIGYFNAIWSGLGTVIVVILGIIIFNDSVDTLKTVGIMLIVAGILLLNLGTEKRESNF